MLPRLTKPEKGNKYYINTSDGGYNPARGNPLRLNKDLTSLSNCVMIYGWFNEIGQQGQVYLKAPWYPYSVIAAAKREGLEVTEEPTLGGIMVWTGGRTKEGHVEGVARFNDDGSITTTCSEFYGEEWVNFRRYKGDGNWRKGCYWMNESYVYQGCIKNPFIEDEEVITDIKVFNADTKKTTIVKGIYKDGRNYLSLSDLSDMGVLTVKYDESKGLPVVGKKDATQPIKLYCKDDSAFYEVKGYYTDHRNYAQLNDLAEIGVMDVSYDPKMGCPVIGKSSCEEIK